MLSFLAPWNWQQVPRNLFLLQTHHNPVQSWEPALAWASLATGQEAGMRARKLSQVTPGLLWHTKGSDLQVSLNSGAPETAFLLHSSSFVSR